MAQEYKVIIDRDLPEELRDEIDRTIRAAVMEKVAKIDLAQEFSIAKLPGNGHTAGMILK